MERDDIVVNQVVFSRNEYGAYTATPNVLVVQRSRSGNPPTVVFRNYCDEPIAVCEADAWATQSGVTVNPNGDEAFLEVKREAAGRYSYEGKVGSGHLGTARFKVLGNSGPGIIITP